ncbi:MAG TPA: type II pantothenate kinase [Bacillales bacterium]|nr:type II pantothenate kinase [Bacillales bacterium]
MDIGVDAGGTLVKIAWWAKGELVFRAFPAAVLDDAARWLVSRGEETRICLTGGRAAELAAKLPLGTETTDEFRATCRGALHLMKQQRLDMPERFVLANVGTGTSIHVVEGTEFRRVSGTGVGGGTFVGLSYLLTGISNFEKLVRLAEQGEPGQLDLLVKDIYTMTDAPIPGELTASNFGKAAAAGPAGAADRVAAVLKMVAETVLVLAMQACDKYEANKAAFIGSTFHNHPLMQRTVAGYEKAAGKKVVFPANGWMSGAVGALLSLKEAE